MTKQNETAEMNESVNEAMGKTHGEAPLSIHIDAYKEGFHIGFTIRQEDNSVVPAKRVSRIIGSLIEEGYLPSWNSETNKTALNGTGVQKIATTPSVVTPVAADPIMTATAPTCGIHGVPMVWREGVSKSTGKPYAFYACPEKNANGTFCNFKPNAVQKGVSR